MRVAGVSERYKRVPPWNGGCDSGPRDVHAWRLTEDADPPLGPKMVNVIHDDVALFPQVVTMNRSDHF